MVFQQSFSHHVISRAALSWLILIALGTQLPASAATSALAHYFPRYQCADNPKAVFCQSFEQNAQGLNFLAEKDAASGLANGSLLLNTERQTLSYKAARTGGHLFTIDPGQLSGFSTDDFYYEALIRPYANSTTDRETLYLTLKDAQADRYFAAGFKVGSSVFTSKLELAILRRALCLKQQRHRAVDDLAVQFRLVVEPDNQTAVSHLDLLQNARIRRGQTADHQTDHQADNRQRTDHPRE